MSKPFKVLLVEDDDPLRGCLRDLMAAEGWTVHDTASGQEAIELAHTARIDFSLMDMHLPDGMTGLDVLHRIVREVRPIPSIMMSGQASLEVRRRALAEQAVFRFLQKPLDLDHLRGSMQLLIQHYFGNRPGS